MALKNESAQRWVKPKRFEQNLVVIGAGAGGLVSAYIAAAVKAKVMLVEKQHMGGDCLHTGCVPSKALIRSAKLLAEIARAQDFGIKRAAVECDFAEIMQRVQETIAQIAPHDAPERYRALGVQVLTGEARMVSPWEVQVTQPDGSQRSMTTRAIVIAAGARPLIPNIPGLADIPYLTSDTLWQLRTLPKRFLVLGGGPIGCEMAQAFARLGSAVTQVEMAPQLLGREDPEVSELLAARFTQEGVRVLCAHKALAFSVQGNELVLLAEHQGQPLTIAFDQVLLALGRVANVSGYGAEELGLQLAPQGTLAVNAWQQTNYPSIFACGDVVGPYQFTHLAAHQAWYATVNALFGGIKRWRTDYAVIPWVTFTDPEVARVGLNEQQARAQGVAYEVSRFELNELDRALADSEAYGFVKVLTPPGKDKILGVTLVGTHASSLLPEFVLAMKYGLGLRKLLSTIHVYPTQGEAVKAVAGVWQRQHVPSRWLPWLARWWQWRRG